MSGDGNKSEITFVDDLGCIELRIPNGNAAGVKIILIVDIHQNDIYIYIGLALGQLTSTNNLCKGVKELRGSKNLLVGFTSSQEMLFKLDHLPKKGR